MLWIIPAVIAAFSFFKLGSLYVWAQVMSALLTLLTAICLLLILGGALFWRSRHRCA